MISVKRGKWKINEFSVLGLSRDDRCPTGLREECSAAPIKVRSAAPVTVRSSRDVSTFIILNPGISRGPELGV